MVCYCCVFLLGKYFGWCICGRKILLLCPYAGDFHEYGISKGQDIWSLFMEALIYLAIGGCIGPCWYYHFSIIPTYRFIYQLCGDFVHALKILLYLKEIIFNCVIYGATVYHQSELYITDFACPDSCCDFSRGLHTWFQVFGQLVIHIYPVWGRSYTRLFWNFLCKLYLYIKYFGIM